MIRLRRLFLAPSWIVTVTLIVAPLFVIFGYSLLTRGVYGGVTLPWTVENYTRLWDSLYVRILGRSFYIAGVSTVFCLLLGFPMALFLARSKHKSLYLTLVMLPFWTSFLVRTYAWMFLLRDTGLINSLLEKLGWIHHPLPLLYNDGAVIIGLVYAYLPFMILPLYATLERLDPNLMEAAADLGAGPAATLARVIVPLSAPGMRAGIVLVFIPCLGAYLTPDLLGGGKSVMIGNLVQNQFTTARDWPFGSALSLALMAIVMLLLWFFTREDSEGLL